jgi:predicted dithiol-disulfide oxidoreductase (DUF899 family)
LSINTVKALPPVVSPAAWLAARKALLAAEEEVTKARDAVAARQRTLLLDHPGGWPQDVTSGP